MSASDYAGTTYQLLVYSFADSDGDGIGDFNGIKNHLDYFESLGVSSLWLSPIHPCDSYHAYDVTDYYSVNPEYGSEADFKALLEAAKAKGIDVYLDYVLNHSGKGHPWFKDAVANPDSPYRNYYFISSNPSADVAAGKFASVTSANSGEWNKAGSAEEASGKFRLDLNVSSPSAPVLTLSATEDAVKSGSSSWNVYYWNASGDAMASFVDNGDGTLYAIVDFTGYTGFLIRKFPNWEAGSKFGASAGNTVAKPGTPMTLKQDGEDITLSAVDYVYYLSCFSSWMPDLNYGQAALCENNATFKDLAASVDKWIKMGVNGLRLDAVKHIYGGIAAWDNSANQTFLNAWYKHCNATYIAREGSEGNIFMVGEVFNEYDDNGAPYSTYLGGLPSVFDFSFWWRLSSALNSQNGSGFTSSLLSQEKLYSSSRKDGIASLKLSNHDEDRTGEVLGRSAAKEKQAGAILLTAEGKSFIYQGEELGYYGNKSSGDEYVRTPMNWDGGAWADGKLSGKTDPMLKGSAFSVSAQSADANSVLSVYRSFGKARATNPALLKGKMSAYNGSLPSNFAAWYMTDAEGGEKLLVVHNLSSSESSANLSGALGDIVVSLGSVSVNGTSVSFGANSSAVFKQ
jgi:glycosidase